MEPEPNNNQALVFATISGFCGALIAGCFTVSQPDNTAFEVVRNVVIGGSITPILLYAAAFVIEIFGNRE